VLVTLLEKEGEVSFCDIKIADFFGGGGDFLSLS
jgi:hypothetical protein